MKVREPHSVGVQTVELILCVAILVLATFAAFQFGTTPAFSNAISAAADEAAREAAKGASIAELEVVVEQALDP